MYNVPYILAILKTFQDTLQVAKHTFLNTLQCIFLADLNIFNLSVMHKAIVKTFLFLEVIKVIRGRKRSLEGQTLNLLLLLYSLGS